MTDPTDFDLRRDHATGCFVGSMNDGKRWLTRTYSGEVMRECFGSKVHPWTECKTHAEADAEFLAKVRGFVLEDLQRAWSDTLQPS